MIRAAKIVAYPIFFASLFVMAIGILDGPPELFALSCVSIMLPICALLLAEIAERVARTP